jgi:DNA polymerase-3 subunit alpha (Gram-positive type)
MPKIIFYDFETTGLNVFHDEVIELAAIDQNGNLYNELFKPEKAELSLYVKKLTGITDDMIKDKKSFKTDCKHFLDFVGSDDDVYFIAHNNNFDMLFLKKYLKTEFNSKWKFIDSINLAKLVWPYKKSYSLAYLASCAEIEEINKHRACGDVATLIKLFTVLAYRFDSNVNYVENIDKIWKATNLVP